MKTLIYLLLLASLTACHQNSHPYTKDTDVTPSTISLTDSATGDSIVVKERADSANTHLIWSVYNIHKATGVINHITCLVAIKVTEDFYKPTDQVLLCGWTDTLIAHGNRDYAYQAYIGPIVKRERRTTNLKP